MPDGSVPAGLRVFRDELIELAEQISKSVVTVRVGDAALNSGSGSGWFYQPGIVVTNNHVVQGESPSVKVRLQGGRVVSGEILGSDPLTDLAVIRCDAPEIKSLAVRQKTPHIGELCFAFGSPLGEYTESVTFGVVSGLGRRMPLDNGRSIENLLQTDAEINPGNSGGPLVDLDGELLGVNVMIRKDGRGMGFAIPASTVDSIVPELVEYGQVVRPRLGVSLEVVEHWNQGIEGELLRVSGAPDGHILQHGDILLALAGRRITNRSDLFDIMRRPLLKNEIPIEIERDGSDFSYLIKLTEPSG
jgi:S1-C subfamily serine protease